MSAGELRERITFQTRKIEADQYGNDQGEWSDAFTVAGRIRPRFGGEEVMAARLAGRQPVTITVRCSDETARIAPEWRAINSRTDEIYNIRAKANSDEKNKYFELLAESGVAA